MDMLPYELDCLRGLSSKASSMQENPSRLFLNGKERLGPACVMWHCWQGCGNSSYMCVSQTSFHHLISQAGWNRCILLYSN